MSRAILSIVVWVAAGLAFAPAVYACSLPAAAPGNEVRAAQLKLRSADVAIYGVVSSVRVLDAPTTQGPPSVGQTIEARVRVTRAFKGKTGRVVRVRGNTNGATCGIGELRVGERLGLLLERPARPYRVSLSSRITLRELLRATRGKGVRRPDGTR